MTLQHIVTFTKNKIYKDVAYKALSYGRKPNFRTTWNPILLSLSLSLSISPPFYIYV